MKERVSNFEVGEYQSGVIPVYDRKIKASNGKVFLVGDSATFVKATTYGGIIQGMMASEALSEILVNGGNYEKAWRKKLGKSLLLHSIVRNKLNKMDDFKYNEMMKLVNKEKVKNLFSGYQRDSNPLAILKLLFKEPRFLKFAI